MHEELFSRFAGTMLRRSLHLSYFILAITLGGCILFLWAARTLDLPRVMIFILASNALLFAWINRRAVLELPQCRHLLTDPRLSAERGTVAFMIAADWISLGVASVTSVHLFACALAMAKGS